MLQDRDAVIVAGVRTPFAPVRTRLEGVSAEELGRVAVREAIERSEVDPDAVDELILGNVGGALGAADLGRVVAMLAKLPRKMPAAAVNRSCASGLEAVAAAASRIRAGEADLVIAAGVESSSTASPFRRDASREGRAPAPLFLEAVPRRSSASGSRERRPGTAPDLSIGLADLVTGHPTGAFADRLARDFDVTREEQDAFALASHRLAAAAWEEGRMEREVVPVPVPPAFDATVARDDGIRRDAEASGLAALAPVFDPRHGTVTRGNASPLGDGAVALVLGSASRARALGLPVLGRVRAWAAVGCDPARMGLGAAFAVPLALKRAGGVALDRVDLVEIHETFAAQVLACRRALESRAFCEEHLGSGPIGPIDPGRLNVNGGALAIGHPLGASGARIVLTLLLEMERRDASLGLAALSAGGGQGAALVLERT